MTSKKYRLGNISNLEIEIDDNFGPTVITYVFIINYKK